MIRFIFVTAFALVIATSAQALSPPPLHQPDGIRADVGYRGVARGHRYGVARGHGHRTLRVVAVAMGLGGTATAGTATTDMATARIGPDLESRVAKSAGAQCGV